jgi:hypothetical protein
VAWAERSGAGAFRVSPRGVARCGKALHLFERVAEPTGGQNSAWQPSVRLSEAALTGPPTAAQTGLPLRLLVREPVVARRPRRPRLGGVCDGAAMNYGGVGLRPARPHDPAASALCRLIR